MKLPFIHLRAHSEYSLIDGIVRIEDYIERAVALNIPAVAITDHMNLFALVKFYREALSAGIKPIIGCDIQISYAEDIHACTLLCKNNAGYKNLIEIISRAYIEGQQSGKPIIQWEWLVQAKEGLLVLSGGMQGDVGKALIQGHPNVAEEYLSRWIANFPNHYYIEIQRTEREREEDYNQAAIQFASRFNIPVIATNDIRFIEQNDFEAHEARVCIQEGFVLDDPKREKRYSDQQYMKSPSEMEALFADIPEALINTVEVAKRCSVVVNFEEIYLPRFPTPNNESVTDYFQLQAQTGLQKRFEKNAINDAEKIKHYQARLQLELDVIIKMGFSGYFLIVADFIAWAKQHQIPVGPGRGSGAGSLVAYVLGITELDPIQHDLLFERFLNPERISMPDFDVDFCMEGRDRVIEYVAQRYGHPAVAQIITYGTMAAKAVVRDVGRVLGMPYGFVDKIAKLIPFELGMTLQKALQQEEALNARYQSEEEVQNLINLALKLEGITRNAGKHAGGVVIAPTRLTDFVPLYCEANSEHVVTQFDKDDVESVGLVKFDFLGLRTLTIIDWALRAINKKQAEIIDISLIPLNDKPSFDLLKRCATTAVFQLESRGMKELIRRLQPDTFEDITALVALFRPGPLQSGMVDDFIDRKHGRAKVNYPHADLEPILRPTYGVILYQEQVMQIAQVLAGYTLGGADILRRAMGKKKPEEMAQQRTVFVEGAKKRNIPEKLAEHIFDLMEKFAGYGFNKSHSAAYALIAYQTAWLKAHFPAEFMAAVLSSDMDKTEKVVGFIHETKTMGLKIRPPHINEGMYHFTVNPEGEIIYGLGAIKGVGESLIQHLCESRTCEGQFKNLFDFCRRADARKLSRRALEPLIKSGALDIFKQPREVLLASVDKALKYSEQEHRKQEQGQHDLFDDGVVAVDTSDKMEYVFAAPWSEAERLQGEKETIGFYLSGHPLETYRQELSGLVQSTIGELEISNSNAVVIAGIVLSVRVITTRTGKRMAIMTLEDLSGRIDITLFSETYQQVAQQLEKDSIFLVKGTVSKDDYTGGIKMVAEGIIPLEEARQRMSRQLMLRVFDEKTVDRILRELPQLLKQFGEGRCPIKIVYQAGEQGAELKLGDAWRIKPCSELLTELYKLCGRDNVVLEYT